MTVLGLKQVHGRQYMKKMINKHGKEVNHKQIRNDLEYYKSKYIASLKLKKQNRQYI